MLLSSRLNIFVHWQPKTLTSLDSSVFTEEDDLVMPELDINPDIPKLDILNISVDLLFFDLFFALNSNYIIFLKDTIGGIST
jgi:hypothetical protein